MLSTVTAVAKGRNYALPRRQSSKFRPLTENFFSNCSADGARLRRKGG